MEFPITRERLQKYRVNEAVLVENKQRVLKEIQVICKDVERIVLTTYESKYIYRIPNVVKNGELRLSNIPLTCVQPLGILKELVVAIKNTFPDSNIMVDPLETYIVIDWS